MENKQILKERVKEYNKLKGARVGDYLLYKGHYVRFSHEHAESLQTSESGSFYLGKGYISFSGGLNHGINKTELINTKKYKKGSVWFFDNGFSGADRDKYFNINFRVFKVKNESKIKDIDILGFDIKEEQLKKTKETITRLNGNGNEYKTHVPTLFIKEKLSEFTREHIYKNTGLKFEEYGNGFKAQPQTSNDILRLLVTYNFKTQYHNGIHATNTLILKFCNDSDFKY